MKVLHVIASMSAEWGGPSVTVQGLTAAFRQLGVHCEIASTCSPDRQTREIETPGIPTHTFETTPLSRVWTGYSPALTTFLGARAGKFDLIHAHEIWPYTTLSAFHAARRHARPFVLSSHGELGKRHLRHKWLKKWCYRRMVFDRVLKLCDALHAVSKPELEDYTRLHRRLPAFYIPNGVDHMQLKHVKRSCAFFDEYPTLRDRRLILFMGRLDPMKGVEILARAFARIAPSFPDVSMIVAGPDRGGKHIMESVFDSAGLTRRVQFTGTVVDDKKRSLLASSHLFVLPSYFEGFSNAVIEALANGVPVVISEHCNFPEVADAGAGLIPSLNSAEFASAIGKILTSDDLRRTMGEAARKLVSEHYTWDNLAQDMLEQYAAMIDRRRHRQP